MFSPLGVCQHPIYLGFWSLDLKLPLTCRSGTLYLNVNIASHLVVELVVRAEHHEAAPRDAEREEHLLGGFPPDREVQQLVELWHEEEVEAVGGAVQHAAADQKGDEDDVGKRGREVDDLATALDAVAKASKNQNPGKKNAQAQVPLDLPYVTGL